MKIKNKSLAIGFVVYLIFGLVKMHFYVSKSDFFITIVPLLFMLWFGGFEVNSKEEETNYENK